MNPIIGVITAIVQIVLLYFKEKAEKDVEKRKLKEEIRAEIYEALKSRDMSRVNGAIDRLRV